MSVRERAWKGPNGERRSAWIADCVIDGTRQMKTFKTKREADTFHAMAVLNAKINTDELLIEVLHVLARRLNELASDLEHVR